MPSLRQIAQDPRKALKALEKELGAESGALLEDMGRLAGTGDEWKNHLPYLVAESYYEDEAARAPYQAHVDACEYCKALVDTLHPSDPQARDFAEQAAAASKAEKRRDTRRYFPAYSVPLAIAASVAATVVAVPALQHQGFLSSPAARERRFVVNELTLQPGKLEELAVSNDPAERYRAAKYYFAVEQPQLAYRQIGEGLELAGLNANDAKKITTAADIPADNSGPTLGLTALALSTLKSAASDADPGHYLELASAQAKLGFHDQSLKSIEKYLQAKKASPQLVAAFSETALAGPEATKSK